MVKQDSAEVAVKSSPLLDAIVRMSTQMERSPADAQRDIIQSVLDAPDDVDAILAESTTLHAEDILGIPHTITDVTWNKSNVADGFPMYAVVHAAHAQTGEDMVYTVGAGTALAQLVKLSSHFPVTVRLKQKDRPTAQGYYPMFYIKG